MSQRTIIDQLRQELGSSEETEHLLDWLQDSWGTLEILKDRFGESRALQIYTASPSCFSNSEQPVQQTFLKTTHSTESSISEPQGKETYSCVL